MSVLLTSALCAISFTSPLDPAPAFSQEWQYHYTADIPTDEGVFPLQVFAPKLRGVFATGVAPQVSMPEPSMLVLGGVLFILRRRLCTHQ